MTDNAENQKPEEELETPETATETPEAAETEAPEAAAPEAAPEADAGSDLEAELAEAKDRMMRALAEAENVRRRAQRDIENANKRAISGFAREMIVVADNLSRALDAVDSAAADSSEAMKSLLTGVEMTAREMLNAFERNGLKRVDPLGERFDPQVHEAMFEYEDPSKPAGSVGQVMEPGYTLHGLTLRPAKVGVTKGGPKPEAAPKPSDQVLKDADGETSSEQGKAYEDQGAKSGAHVNEEL